MYFFLIIIVEYELLKLRLIHKKLDCKCFLRISLNPKIDHGLVG